MRMSGQIARKEISTKKDVLIGLSRKIWENPERAYQEVKASQWIADFLEKEGFAVERGYAGMPTAIRAVWGDGEPYIGFLGEYDALPGLSQKVSSIKEPVVEGGIGHGCGHNLLGVACVAAVLGAKQEMVNKGLTGTLVFYGCPAEEVLTGKVFMARGGAFRELDLSFAYHPSTSYIYSLGKLAAMNSVKFHFKGKTAHAGGNPQDGRSALDAAEIMSVGANYLREHVPDGTRIHYAYTDVNEAPNVVPDKTTVWYFVRSLSREVVEQTYERLIKVAEGAAMMTETEVEIEFLGGCYETLQNSVLMNLIRDTAIELGPVAWTEEDIVFAEKLNEQGDMYRKKSAE